MKKKMACKGFPAPELENYTSQDEIHSWSRMQNLTQSAKGKNFKWLWTQPQHTEATAGRHLITFLSMLGETVLQIHASCSHQLHFWTHEATENRRYKYEENASNHLTPWNICLRSGFGLDQDAMASQKNMKCCRTPLGFMLIMAQTPRKAESFSSLSRMFLRVLHHMQIKLDK